jgi:hypothetical protein
VAPQDFLQGLVYFYSTVVVNESLLPESVHEQIDPRARGADHQDALVGLLSPSCVIPDNDM